MVAIIIVQRIVNFLLPLLDLHIAYLSMFIYFLYAHTLHCEYAILFLRFTKLVTGFLTNAQDSP